MTHVISMEDYKKAKLLKSSIPPPKPYENKTSFTVKHRGVIVKPAKNNISTVHMNGNFSDIIDSDIAFHKDFSLGLFVKQTHNEMNYDVHDNYDDEDDDPQPPPKAA